MDPLTLAFLIKIIDGIAFAAQYAPAMLDKIRAELGPLQEMIDDGRPPTAAELARLDAKTAGLTARLEAVAEADRIAGV